MKVSYTYISYTVGFSGALPKPISLKYSMYGFPITGDNSEPIAKPSLYWFMSGYPWKIFVHTDCQHFHLVICWILVCPSSEGSDYNQFWNTDTNSLFWNTDRNSLSSEQTSYIQAYHQILIDESLSDWFHKVFCSVFLKLWQGLPC